MDQCCRNAEQRVQGNRDSLGAMKNALMEYETIDAEQVDDLVARRKVRPPRDWHDGNFNGQAKDDDVSEKSVDEDKGSSPIGGPAQHH